MEQPAAKGTSRRRALALFPIFTTLLALFSFSVAAHADPPLRSPVDFKKQSALFQKPGPPFSCKPAPDLPKKLESVSFYTDEKNSIVDPELLKKFRELTGVVTGEENYLSQANIRFLEAATPAERSAIGECVLSQLLKFARDGAFLASDDIRGGGAVRLMSVTPILTYLILRDGHRVPLQQDEAIRIWIRLLMERLIFLEEKFPFEKNNIDDWTAAAYALGAVALERRDLLNRAIGIVREEAAKVDMKGALPVETARGRMGLTYNLFVTQAIGTVVAVASANGIDLLDGPSGQPLLRLMERMVRAINEPKTFLEVTDEPKAIEPEHLDRQNMGWLELYYDKTGSPEARKAICANLPLYSWRTGAIGTSFSASPPSAPFPQGKSLYHGRKRAAPSGAALVISSQVVF